MTAPPFIWRATGQFPARESLADPRGIRFLSVVRKKHLASADGPPVRCCVSSRAASNPYIAAMALLVLLAAYLRWLIAADTESQQSSSARILLAAGGAGLSLGLTVVALVIFGFLRPGEGGYAGAGYKIYSMNLLAPINPWEFPGLLWGELPAATKEQYEGYNYLGLGIIGLGLAALVWRPSVSKGLFGRAAIAGWLIFIVSSLSCLVPQGNGRQRCSLRYFSAGFRTESA